MKINLSVEETNNYLNIVRDYLEAIQDINSQVVTELNDILATSHYNKLQQEISNVIDRYIEIVKNDIEVKTIDSWEHSGASLKACMHCYQAGEGAENVASQVQLQLRGMLSEILHIEKGQTIETDRPVISEEHLERVENIYRWAKFEVDEIRNQYTGKIDNLSADNDIYATLKSLFIEIANIMNGFFDEAITSFEKVEELVEEIKASMQNIAVETGVRSTEGISKSSNTMKELAKAAINQGVTIELPTSGTMRSMLYDEDDTQQAVDALKEELDIDLEDEQFSDKNLELVVKIAEIIVGQLGQDRVNKYVDANYDKLRNNSKNYSNFKAKNTSNTKKDYNTSNVGNGKTRNKSKYGKYNVTPQAVSMMKDMYDKVNMIMTPIDTYYKEKFQHIEDSYVKVSQVIHNLSNFLGGWSTGTLKLSDLIPNYELAAKIDNHELVKKITEGILTATSPKLELLIKGSAAVLKGLDKVMPLMKKSQLLMNLSNKFWELTRQDMQIPYFNKYIEQYIVEHYNMKHGINVPQSYMFEYTHPIVREIKDEKKRRIFENALFAADACIGYQRYAERSAYLGRFLNLARAALVGRIPDNEANELLDKFYATYMVRENISAKVYLNPLPN